MRFTTLAAAAALAGGLGLTSAVHAAPVTVAAEAEITDVAYGCGPGFIPNRFGFCRPIYRPYGFYGPRYGYFRPRPFYGPRRFYGRRF